MRLLRSLDRMDCPLPADVEVLVIDNGSTDGTDLLLAQESRKDRRFSLRVLHEGQQGKARALNRGLASATGAFLFVVDDDVVAHPQFLLGHLECYRTTYFDALQGRVLPGVDPEGKPASPQRLWEYNIPIADHGDDIREVKGMIGCNMSFKREVFAKVGLFDVRLGPGASGFSEDTEYSMRVRRAGFKIGYAPGAVVYHELSPGRYGGEYNRLVHYRKGLSRSVYQRHSICFHVLPDLFANSIRYLLYRGLGKREKTYKSEGRVMRYWGYLMGRIRRRIGAGAEEIVQSSLWENSDD